MTMNTKTSLGFLSILGAVLIAVSCSTSARRDDSSASQNRPSDVPALSAPTPVSPIRAVDLDNISYPNFPDYSDPNGRKKKYITLKPGEGGPNFINYGDITGDGIEEAMVALGIDNHGSAIPDYVYIFTLENGKLKLIWDFETGDRADGGLRNVYADNRQLVIELFGKDRVIGGQLYRGEEGLCCPSLFTRTTYRWTGKRFEQTSKEVLKNPSGDANPVMPQYAPKM
jgi:hypothetical protein